MAKHKLQAGEAFPAMTVPKLGGGSVELGKPSEDHDWKMVVVYRGKHCPLCTRYLKTLNEMLPDLKALGIDVVAVSADPAEKAEAQTAEIEPAFTVGHDLTLDQMKTLGLYISDPRSAEETDRPFAEPGLFVVNDVGDIQIVDMSNAPFSRPDLQSMVKGLTFIRNPENQYPIRGTYR